MEFSGGHYLFRLLCPFFVFRFHFPFLVFCPKLISLLSVDRGTSIYDIGVTENLSWDGQLYHILYLVGGIDKCCVYNEGRQHRAPVAL